MKVTPLSIHDVLLIEPRVFEDARGFFFESFRVDVFRKETSLNVSFVQDNHSKSSQGVLRGLHYQILPHAQGKLVRVIQGEVLDIAVDLRQSSATFGQYVSEILSSENKKQLFIPEGFAHGFLTLSKTAEVFYKTTDFYHPESERCILWNDATLNIKWPENLKIQLSPKDLLGQSFKSSELFGVNNLQQNNI
jgi:dTDP-4-dehydrorhamnose 3,5-epimerase